MTNSIYLDIILLGLANIIIWIAIFWSCRYKLIPALVLLKANYALRAKGINIAEEFHLATKSLLEGSCSVILISDRQDKFVYADPTTSALICKKDILKFLHNDFFINDNNARHIQHSKTIQIKLTNPEIKEILFKAISRKQSQEFNHILEKIKGNNNSYRSNLRHYFRENNIHSIILSDESQKQELIDDLKQHLVRTCDLESLPTLSKPDIKKKLDSSIREAGKWLKLTLEDDKYPKGSFEHIIAPALDHFFNKKRFLPRNGGYSLSYVIKQISVNIGEKSK
jgi:hypothetical protein